MSHSERDVTLTLETTAESWQEDRKSWGAAVEVREMPSARRSGTGLREAAFVEPVSILMTISAAMIAKRIVDHWLVGQEQGVQIDLRATPPMISRLANVPRGFVVLIDDQGKATTQKVAYDKGEQLGVLIESYLVGKPARE